MDMPIRKLVYPHQNPRLQLTTDVSWEAWEDPEGKAPHNYWKATGRNTDKTIILTGAAQLNPPMNQQRQEDCLDQEWGISQEVHGDSDQLAKVITTGIAIAVSDRSFQDSHGSAAWTIEGQDKQDRILGKGRTPGAPEDQSAY